MATAVAPLRRTRVYQVGGCTLVDVPWDEARACQQYFRTLHIGSMLHMDPHTREACLNLRAQLSMHRVEELLARWDP